jgi:flagellar hook-associated protein 2
MTTSINTSGITTDGSGRVRVSGLSSSIDWKAIVDAQITAKRQPAVNLENKVSANTTKIAELREFKTKAAAVSTAVNLLRGDPALGAADVFKTKIATGTTAALPGAPSGFVPSGIDSLLLTSVTQNAQAGTHRITVNQLATAQQLRATDFASTTTALATLDPGLVTGNFTVNGKSIALTSTDSLVDLRSKINNADAGVTATVVSASPTSHYLVLTATKTGVANGITLGGTGAVLDSLGLTNGDGVTVQYPLQAAQDAALTVNGIGGITRASNEINDILPGVTLSLSKAEPDTEITLKIAPDLNGIKTQIANLVTAYNDLRTFVTDQRTAKDRNDDGRIGDAEFGSLANDSTVREAFSQLQALAAATNDSNTDGYRSLGQLGVVILPDFSLKLDDAVFDGKLIANVDAVRDLFALKFSTSDSRVSLQTRSGSMAAGTYYLNVAGTDGSANVTSANLRAASGAGVGGADDGTIAILNGKTLSVQNTSAASGLGLFFNGGESASGVDDIMITVSRGVADQFYDFFDNLTKTNSGSVDTLITQLESENTGAQSRIDTIDARLEITRKTLEAKFIRMEQVLAQLEQTKSRITEAFQTNNDN